MSSKMLLSPLKLDLNKIKELLAQAEMTAVMDYILCHSTTDRRYPRLVRLWQMYSRGYRIQLTDNPKEPLLLDDQPFHLARLDERALWN